MFHRLPSTTLLVAAVAFWSANAVPIRVDGSGSGSGSMAIPPRPKKVDPNVTVPPPRPRPTDPPSPATGSDNVTNSSVAAGGQAGGQADGEGKGGKVKDPCKRQCKPSIDKNHSVIEVFQRRRAQAALIGDYGKGPKGCSDDNEAERANNATHFTWTIDWGDDESYIHREETVWPYQALHEYHKKGKYTVNVAFCHHLQGCEDSCSAHKKSILVK